MRVHAPGLLQQFPGITRFALFDIAARRHDRCWHQIGRQAVGLNRRFARLNAVALSDDFARLR